MSKDKHKASEDTALCKVLYTKQPSYRSSQSLEPLHPNLIQNHFMNDDSFHFRKAFSDGSCFFHSVVAALNLHENLASDDPHARQSEVFSNVKQLLKLGGAFDDRDNKTSKFNNFMHKHLFVHDDFCNLSLKEQTKLGWDLRLAVRDSVRKHWDEYWRKGATLKPDAGSTSNLQDKFPGIHSKDHVCKLLENTTAWADVYMILYVMDVLDINIWFIDDTNHSTYCGIQGHNIQKQPTMFILWTDHSHFQPIVKLECTRKDGTPHLLTLFKWDTDPIVRHFDNFNQTRGGCSAVRRHHRLH